MQETRKGPITVTIKPIPTATTCRIQNTVQVVLSAQGPQEMMAALVLSINNLIISPQTMQTCGSYLFSVVRLSFLIPHMEIIIPTF